MNLGRPWRWGLGWLGAAALATLAVRADPPTFNWSGLQSSDWFTAGNWQGGALPKNDGSVIASFSSTVTLAQSVYASSSVSLYGLTLSGGAGDFSLSQGGAHQSPNGQILTLGAGGLTFAPAASTLTAQLIIPVTLATDQTWNVASGTVQLDAPLAGTATLTKTGGGLLELTSNSSATSNPVSAGFAGNILHLQGGLTLGDSHALGSGTLTIGPANANPALNPTLTANGNGNSGGLAINNEVVLNGLLTLSPDSDQLTLGGLVVLAADTTVNAAGSALFVGGNIGETGGSHKLTIDGFNTVVLLNGNAYSGGTTVNRGVLIFGQESSIPITANALRSSVNGYIGIVFVPADPQADFLDLFDKANTQGTIGFDTNPNATAFNVFTGTLDLTGFAASARIGSATFAAITGNIIPQGSNYQFGGGGGFLAVGSPLTGTYGVQAITPTFPNVISKDAFLSSASLNSAPPIIRLVGTNTYTGATVAQNAAIVFAAGSLPPGTTLNAGAAGYIGTEDTTLTTNVFASRFLTTMQGGTIGFDVSPTTSGGYRDVGYTETASFDLSRFVSPTDPGIYIGSTSYVAFWPNIILPANSTTYRFAGYQGGEIIIVSQLTGANSVVIGDPLNVATFGNFNGSTNSFLSIPSTVVIANGNSYTGGTTLYGGELQAYGNTGQVTPVFGSGPVTVAPNIITPITSKPTALFAAAVDQITVPNAFILNAPLELVGGTAQNFNLAGVISGSAALYKSDANTVSLSAANTMTGGIFVDEGTLIFNNDAAAAGGALTVSDFSSLQLANGTTGGNVYFTTASPVISSLASDANSGGSNGNSLAVVGFAPSVQLTVTQPTDTTYHGAFYGDATTGLVKTGSGALYVGGNSPNFAGSVTVSGGILAAGQSNSLGTGPITVNGGKLSTDNNVTLTNPLTLVTGQIGGFGTFNPESGVTLSRGLTLAPGGTFATTSTFSQTGTVAFGGQLTLTGGAAYQVQLISVAGGNGSGWDYTNVSGALSLINTSSSNPLTIKLVSLAANGTPGLVNDFNAGGTYSWQILGAVGGINGFDPAGITVDFSAFQNSLGGGSFSVSQAGNFVDLNFTPVPEPATWALLLAGAGLLVLRTRRRPGR